MADIDIVGAKVTWASPGMQDTGLVGWVHVILAGGIALDGITLRRTREGRLSLSFPCRRDRAGREHPYVRPVDNDVRVSFERQVFEALGVEGDRR